MMGMFDTVYVSLSKLPISEEDRANIDEKDGFQTKDFDCELAFLYIEDDGKLVRREPTWGEIERDDSPKILNFHGWFRFYTLGKNRDWYEFQAKFTDGRLVEITGGKDKS